MKEKKQSREEEIAAMMAESYPRRFSLRAVMIAVTLLSVLVALGSAGGMSKLDYVYWGGLILVVNLAIRFLLSGREPLFASMVAGMLFCACFTWLTYGKQKGGERFFLVSEVGASAIIGGALVGPAIGIFSVVFFPLINAIDRNLLGGRSDVSSAKQEETLT